MKIKTILFAMVLLIAINFNVYTYAEEVVNSESTKIEYYSSVYMKYTNNPYGYEIVLPSSLVLNEDILSVKSRFYSDELVVEVLYDDFTDTLDNKTIYDDYGNRGIKKNDEFKITAEYKHNYGGVNSHIVLYEREKITSIRSDRNYYATISIPRSYKEVITVFIKSAQPIYLDYIMPQFKFISKSGNVKSDKVFEPIKKNFDPLTQKFYDEYFINSQKVNFGIFEPAFPTYPYTMDTIESKLDYKFPVALTYNSCDLPFKEEYMNNAKQKGKVIEYTLYTTAIVNGKDKDLTLDIMAGKYDVYLDSLADGFNKHDYPVLFRVNNEMNGAWVLYSSYFVGKDTDLYISCWRYIYDRFKAKGVDNLIFVWNPNEISFPNYSYNNYLSYYPGDEYVDIVGLTAYNTGTYYESETWRTLQQAYDDFYYDYVAHFNHPMMITEFSCSSIGGDKGAWFTDMFQSIKKYDRIKLAVLWNGQDHDTTKPEKTVSRDYRLDLDENIIKVLREGLKQ